MYVKQSCKLPSHHLSLCVLSCATKMTISQGLHSKSVFPMVYCNIFLGEFTSPGFVALTFVLLLKVLEFVGVISSLLTNWMAGGLDVLPSIEIKHFPSNIFQPSDIFSIVPFQCPFFLSYRPRSFAFEISKLNFFVILPDRCPFSLVVIERIGKPQSSSVKSIETESFLVLYDYGGTSLVYLWLFSVVLCSLFHPSLASGPLLCSCSKNVFFCFLLLKS